jgi:hypothetical protein
MFLIEGGFSYCFHPREVECIWLVNARSEISDDKYGSGSGISTAKMWRARDLRPDKSQKENDGPGRAEPMTLNRS